MPPDDPRVSIYYISINPCHYIVLGGWGDKCNSLQIMKRNQHDLIYQSIHVTILFCAVGVTNVKACK
jgi:hypothetical protein